jgi:ABC-2 type transport system ATP-binding protein
MNILEVSNLTKSYPSFQLDNISFSIPKGYIMGFIGENGAGKTTTLNAILNIINKDKGSIKIFGLDMETHELEIKKDIAYMTGNAFYPKKKLKDITSSFKRFFIDWDENIYQEYIKKFHLDEQKKVDELSRGMQVKYQLSLALSHHAKLIILDEPTSGLDPVARDQLLQLFQEIVEDGEVSILFSTHITSDLEKCADYITFIQNGKLVDSTSKDELLDKYLLVNGPKELLSKVKNSLISYKENAFGFTGLLYKEDFQNNLEFHTAKPKLEDIMIFYAERREY